MATSSKRRNGVWLYPLAFLGLTSAFVFFVFFLLDWSSWQPAAGPKPGPLWRLFEFESGTATEALGTLAGVIAAVLGIVITVVSIVVQLAATRYTPRIAEMFFRDRTNLAVLGFFVVAAIDAVWVALSIGQDFVPRLSILMCLLLTTTSVLLMVPYFAYVFDFLDPERVVSRIQEQAVESAIGEGPREGVGARQQRVLQAIEQLADISVNAVSQRDKLIATGAVDALKELTTRYLERKSSAGPAWFAITDELRKNPDFVSMSKWSVDELESRRLWLEWKVLRQYQALYNESLGQLPDMNHLLAIDLRYMGETALWVGDAEALALVVKFYNTFLRATINREEVRTAYNVLNQYRQLCEKVIFEGGHRHEKLAVEIAGYLRYYGQIAHGARLGFITETVGYDLAALCEQAFTIGAACHDQLLNVLLTLDREAETGEQELTLRGVRKAQAKLATFYMASDAEKHARAIAEDMGDEPATRLRSIRDELLRVESRDFWEVIDRGTNFDYLDEPRKAQLRVFFSWFRTLDEPGAASA